MFGDTAQSWVDPSDPLHLEFEYVQRVAEALELTVLARPVGERVRVVHLGGAGMTIPRWVSVRRPHTAQVVCEPDVELTEEVRRLVPLPAASGIKVRAVDGRSGVAAMPDDWLDALVVDAFDGSSVPGDLVTEEFWAEAARVARPGAVVIANITDRAPFGWAKRVVAGVRQPFPNAVVSAEAAVWKGRRFGNVVVVASDAALPVPGLEQRAHRAAFPYQLLSDRALHRWLGGAQPFTDADATPSPAAPRGRSWFS
ncbi:MAG: fused MFS/spermidine synthase [Nigerium sp.]|nr:fused MFS/spermidine synthase [Nigerium sp.]